MARFQDEYIVQLDGKTPKTPRGHSLALPTELLATLVAAEWRVQGQYVELALMPATRLAHTTLDAVSVARSQTAASLERYAGSDLLCYLAEAPASLVRRQVSAWAPLLDWARDVLGLEFVQTAGVVHQPQPAATLEKVGRIALRMDDFALAGCAFAAAMTASTILAFALRLGHLDGAGALAASRIEETFQEERWGVDAEAAERTQLLLNDAVMLERWFAALGTQG